MNQSRRSRIRALPILLAASLLALAPASGRGQGQAAPPKPSDLTARLIGHAHIDLSWLWRWEESVLDVALQTFKGTLAQMEKMPGLTFAQSQPAVYEAVAKADPVLFQTIKDKVKLGTWRPVGGMWAEPDLNMPDGEALARQLLYGKRYFLDQFGVDVTVGWNPDTFGHNWQMPQILAKAGIPYYVFGRCAPENAPAFWWEGKDGTRVLCYVPQGWYNVSLSEGIRDTIVKAAAAGPLRDFMILYGAGDHGGGPRDADLEAIRALRQDPAHPKLEFTTPEAFFETVKASGSSLPIVKKELNFTFPGCYTTQTKAKRANRELEGLLAAAEAFSSLAVASGYRDYYPERDLDEAWKIVLRNQFHDILDGSSIGPVYDEALEAYAEARERGRRALDFSLETIMASVDTRGESRPILVFNPLLWERTDVVMVPLPGPAEGPVRVLDAKGVQVVSQVETVENPQGRPGIRVVFTAEKVPSLGYKLFRIERRSRAGIKSASSVSAWASGLENEFLKVTLDPKTGWIKSIVDKAARREILRAPACLLALADEPEAMSAWELGLKGVAGKVGEGGSRIEVVESGPARAVVRIRSGYRSSSFDQELVLTRGVPRLDIRVRGNWQERSLMIKAAFPLALEAAAAEFEIPFGTITRPTDGTEVPALRWIDVSSGDGSYGVGILNDSKYGFDVKGSEARVSLWHGAFYPDPEADRGPQEARIAIYPHQGGWKEGRTLQRGREFNAPLLVRSPLTHPGSLPAETSFVKVGPENVILSALKKDMGYYERNWIIRLYEAYGLAAEARLELPWDVTAYETDLIERPAGGVIAQGRVLTIPLRPYEIKTVRLVRK